MGGWKDTVAPPPVGSHVDRKDPLIPEQPEPSSWKDTVRPPGQTGPNKEMHRVIAKTSTPEQEALVQKVHAKTFLPKDIIRSDPRTAKNFQQFRDIQKAISSAPATARFLSMAENMAVARDKAKELARAETNLLGFFGHNFTATPAQIAMGNVASTYALDPDKPEDRERYIKSLIGTEKAKVLRTQAELIADGMDPDKARTEAARRSIEADRDLWQGVAETEAFQIPEEYQVPETFWEKVFAAAGGSAPGMILSAVNMPAGTTFFTQQIYGSEYENYVRQGADPARARDAALTSALMQMPLEYAGNLIQFKAFASALKPGGLKNFFLNLAEGAASEGLEEYLQSYPQLFGEIYATNPDISAQEALAELLNQVTTAEFQMDALEQGAIGGTIGTFLPGAGGIVSAPVNYARNRKYKKVVEKMESAQTQQQQSANEQQALMQLRADLEATDLQSRTPRAVENFAQELIDKHGALPVHAYIDGEVLGTAIEQNTEEAQQVLDGLGISHEDVAEATANGTDVVVPLKKYAAHVFGTQTDQMLMNDVRLSATTLTGNQMQAAQQEMAAEIQQQIKQIEEIEAAETAFEQERQEIFEDVYEKVLTAGQTKEVAEKTATYWGALFGAYANRYSDSSPMTLYRTVGLATEQGGIQTGGLKQAAMSRSETHQTDDFIADVRSGKIEFYAEPTVPVAVRESLGDGEVVANLPYYFVRHLDNKRPQETDDLVRNVGRVLAEADDVVFTQKDRTGTYGDRYAAVTYEGEQATVVVFDYVQSKKKGHLVRARTAFKDNAKAVKNALATMRAATDVGSDSNKPKSSKGKNVLRVLSALNEKIDTSGNSVKVLEQTAQNSGANAQVLLNIGVGQGTLISMFESADLSSFLHESGHIFFELLGYLANQPNASEAAKADWQVVLEYVADVEDSTPAGAAGLTSKQHEKLARTMEAYFMEGKAPSMTLRKVFTRFSDWLKGIYNNLAGLSQAAKQDINPTPEIIGLMERMFATDSEIAQAQDYYGRKEEYKNMAAEVSEEEMQKYVSAQQDAEDQARDNYLRQLVKEWASGTNNRKDIENKIKAELKGETVYAVQAAIRDAGGLDIDGLDIAVGEALRKQLSKKGLTKQGGVSPEIIAAQYGYENVGRMAQDIIRAEKLNTRAARLTDQAVNTKLRGMQEGQVADGQPKAVKAVHNDASLKVLLMELEMLRKKRMPKGAESQLRNITITAKRNALREFAKQTIAAKTVAEARRYDVFSRAEARAAKDAEAALKKGDYTEAEQAKLRQITNHVLVLEAVRVREEIKAKVTKAKKKAKQKSSSENTRQLLRDIIIRFGMMSRRPGESFEAMIKRQHLNVEAFNQNIEEYNANLGEGAEKAKAVDFKTWTAWAKERGYEPVISPLVEDRAIAKPLGSLTVGEFRGIVDTVDSIAHTDLEERTFILEGKRIDLDELVHKLIDKMSENYTPDQLRAAMKTFEKQQRDKSRKGAAKSKLAAFDAAMLHVEDLLYVLDGGELGIWHDTFMVLASEMEHRENELVTEMNDTIDALFSKHFTKKQLRELHDPKKGVYIEEIGQTLTRAQLIRVGLDMGNEGNWLRRRDGHGWRDDQMHAAKDQLLEHELHFIQGIWDANETLRPEAFAVEQEISGVMPERVVATALETKYGVFPGGYFPSKIDPKYDIKKRQRDAAEDSLIFGDPNIGYTDVKHGSTKKRAKTAGNASLSPNLSDIGTHIYEVAHMIAYRRGVVQLGKLFRHGAFDEALQTYLGEEHGSVLLPWVKDMSAPPVLPATPIDKMLRAIRLGMSVKSLAKFSVGAQQVAGLTSSAAKLSRKGNRNLVKYVAYYYGWPPNLWKDNTWINEKSKFMRDRMEHTTREVDDVFRGKSYQQANMEKLGNLAMKFLIGGPQKFFVDIVTWRAAYETALQEGKSEKDAIKYADHLVRTSQGGGGKKDQSEIQRSQSEGTKAVTYFFSFMNKAYNIASVNFRGKNKSYGEAAWVALMLFIIGPTAAEFLSGRQPDEDEDESVHFWAAKNTARFASGMIPVIGDVIEMAITGFEPSSPAFSPLGSAGKVIGHSIEYAQGERELTRNTIKALMDVVGVWTKMPTDQMYITGTGMYDLMTDHPEAHVKDLVFKPKDRR